VDRLNGDIWLYYTGYLELVRRLSMGLAVSTDGGLSFTKMFSPIMDRSD